MLKDKIEALVRYTMVYGFSNILTLPLVTEFPRSGGTWLCQMLADYLEIPFPRNKIPLDYRCVIHGHYLYFPTLKNVIVLYRDGRDVMVSYYFHSLFPNEIRNSHFVKTMRGYLAFKDYHDVIANLPRFLEFVFTRKPSPRFNWAEFVDNWADRNNTYSLKYENLLSEPLRELSKLLATRFSLEPDIDKIEAIVAKNSFRSTTGRKPGEESRSSFARKGIAGDWKNYFSSEASRVFNHFAGKQLIKLGYEDDESWVSQCRL
jgi:hypothetical protein